MGYSDIEHDRAMSRLAADMDLADAKAKHMQQALDMVQAAIGLPPQQPAQAPRPSPRCDLPATLPRHDDHQH